MNEIPIEIRKSNDKSLRGIVHIPSNVSSLQERRIGINIIIPGIKYRVAPNRLSVKLARSLCAEGFYVLRADPEGIGESDGDLEKGKVLKDIFFDIQRGMFVDDTVLLHKFFIKEYTLHDTVLIGNCGGATTALLAQSRLGVTNLVLIDMPITYARNTSYRDQILRGGSYADASFYHYLAKIFYLRSWLRFFTLKSNYSAIYAVIKSKWTKVFVDRLTKANNTIKQNKIELYTDVGEELNIEIFEAFDHFKKEGKALLICAEYDPNTPVFDQYFVKHFPEIVEQNQRRIIKRTIKEANHIYRTIQAQENLICLIKEWLKNYVLTE